jgi:dipeptidase
MCDTLVAVPPATADGAVWFGKNSDREPGEAQVVEHLSRARHAAGAKVRCTYVELPQVSETYEVVLSRPFWMWGCEMGANEHGLVVGNEAVFTRMPAEEVGLTGMDLQRLALERTANADEALELITRLLAEHGQGGGMGYRHRGFRYCSSFILADPREAWVLETAGRYWAAEKVVGARTISNGLTIGTGFDRVHEGAADFARKQGWLGRGEDLDFARRFGSRLYAPAVTGSQVRRACTLRWLTQSGPADRDSVLAALRDHGGRPPAAGVRLDSICAHASWLPTRSSGQTSGSMLSRLATDGARHWFTGSTSPCLSVFKPVPLGGEKIDTGPVPGAGFDDESLFWRHERLHRVVLADYERRRASFDEARRVLEAGVAGPEAWGAHREAIASWTERALAVPTRSYSPLFTRYWRRQSRLDRVPA